MLKRFIPRKGLVVREPKSMAIVPETGIVIDWDASDSTFWRRRVNSGDGMVEDYSDHPEKIEEKKEEKTFKGRK
jgi:hypothetical protein